MIEPIIVAATITVTGTVIASVVGALINKDKLIITDSFRWRRPSRHSFVILINGGSGAGKTTLAWALARKYNIVSVFGTDYLRESVRVCQRKVDPEESSPIFLSSFETGDRFPDQCKEINGPLLAIMNRVRKKRDPVIIEGVNIMASQIFEEIPLDARNGVLFINLFIDEQEAHSRRLRERGITSNEDSQETDKYIRNIESVRRIDRLLKDDTEKFVGRGAFVRSIENSGEVSETIDMIERQIRQFFKANNSMK